MPLMRQWSEKLGVIYHKRIYKGRSMEGTFRFGDLLIIEGVLWSNIRPGDVLVYRGQAQNGQEEIVHRVIDTLPDGLVAQGDNNPVPDNTLVTEKNLVGRVSHLQRHGKRSRLHGGRSGLLCMHIHRGWEHVLGVMWQNFRNMGRKYYGWLRQSGLVARLWRPSIVKVQLMTDSGPLVKYVCRNRTVASHWVDEGRFRCRKPYDLVILEREELSSLME
jgi:signal peptidase I